MKAIMYTHTHISTLILAQLYSSLRHLQRIEGEGDLTGDRFAVCGTSDLVLETRHARRLTATAFFLSFLHFFVSFFPSFLLSFLLPDGLALVTEQDNFAVL
jgi:hypothetical protein